jgi:hypothetical protein
MRCSKRTVGKGNFLRLVIKVYPREFMFLHAFHHIGEAILLVSMFAVGVYAYKPNALGGVLFNGSAGHLIGAYHIGVVVAGEEDNMCIVAEV